MSKHSVRFNHLKFEITAKKGEGLAFKSVMSKPESLELPTLRSRVMYSKSKITLTKE